MDRTILNRFSHVRAIAVALTCVCIAQAAPVLPRAQQPGMGTIPAPAEFDPVETPVSVPLQVNQYTLSPLAKFAPSIGISSFIRMATSSSTAVSSGLTARRVGTMAFLSLS